MIKDMLSMATAIIMGESVGFLDKYWKYFLLTVGILSKFLISVKIAYLTPQALVSGNFFLPRYYIYTTRYVTVHL